MINENTALLRQSIENKCNDAYHVDCQAIETLIRKYFEQHPDHDVSQIELVSDSTKFPIKRYFVRLRK